MSIAKKVAVEGLRKAADFFRTHNWGKGRLHVQFGETYCILGGMGVGLYDDCEQGYLLHEKPEGLVALTAVNATLGKRGVRPTYSDPVGTSGRTMMENTFVWNDQQAKNKEEIIGVLEDAATTIEKELADEGKML